MGRVIWRRIIRTWSDYFIKHWPIGRKERRILGLGAFGTLIKFIRPGPKNFDLDFIFQGSRRKKLRIMDLLHGLQ